MLQWFAIAILQACSETSHAGRLAEGKVNVQAQHMNNAVTPKYATLVKMSAADKVKAMESWSQADRTAAIDKLRAMESWKIEKVEMLGTDVDWHTGLKLTTNDRDNPHLLYHVSTDVIITSYSGAMAVKYNKVLASVKDEPLPRGLTLSKLADCVDGAQLLTKDDMNGRCLTFTLRVMRLALGDCECNGCGSGVPNNLQDVGRISKPETRKRLIVDKDAVNRFIFVVDHLAEKKTQLGDPTKILELINKAIEALRHFTNVWPEGNKPVVTGNAPADHNIELVIPDGLRK